MRIDTGNANSAGATSRGWFVGDLVKWAADRGETLVASETPRQTSRLEVKWLVHPAGDRRTAWADPDRFVTVGVLVQGDMQIALRAADGSDHSVRLSTPGDYVAWYGPEWSHTWYTDSGCTMLTVRWPVQDLTAAS